VLVPVGQGLKGKQLDVDVTRSHIRVGVKGQTPILEVGQRWGFVKQGGGVEGEASGAPVLEGACMLTGRLLVQAFAGCMVWGGGKGVWPGAQMQAARRGCGT
jgi:hypothetical protein